VVKFSLLGCAKGSEPHGSGNVGVLFFVHVRCVMLKFYLFGDDGFGMETTGDVTSKVTLEHEQPIGVVSTADLCLHAWISSQLGYAIVLRRTCRCAARWRVLDSGKDGWKYATFKAQGLWLRHSWRLSDVAMHICRIRLPCLVTPRPEQPCAAHPSTRPLRHVLNCQPNLISSASHNE
jgi:hypothetical protein